MSVLPVVAVIFESRCRMWTGRRGRWCCWCHEAGRRFAFGYALAHLLREAVADQVLVAMPTLSPEAVAETVADVPGRISATVSARSSRGC
jgi:hypothetical protein